jgi:hypothetical protein
MSLLDQRTSYLYLLSAELNEGAPAEEWNAWYDGEHVPELLTVPGIVSATRFQERGNPRRYLAGYQLEHPEVFEEARYREVTGWQRFAPHVKGFERAVYKVTRTEFPPV